MSHLYIPGSVAAIDSHISLKRWILKANRSRLSGKLFCDALDSIEQHKELWSKQVNYIERKQKAQTFLAVC